MKKNGEVFFLLSIYVVKEKIKEVSLQISKKTCHPCKEGMSHETKHLSD